MHVWRPRHAWVIWEAIVASLGLLATPALSQTCPQPSSYPPTGGRTHYVSATGSDPSTCPSWGANFRTLTRASQCALPGDTIYVRGGRYYEKVWIRSVGSASNPITIQPYPGEWVILDGGGGLGNFEAIVSFEGAFYVNFSGFELARTGVYSPDQGGYGLRVMDSVHLNISGNLIHDTARNGITASGCHLTFSNNEVYNTVMRNQWEWSSSHDAAAASWVQLASGQPSYDVNWINNNIHNNWGECLIALHVDTSVVSGNLVHDCYGVNVYVDSSRNVTVSGNYLYASGDTYNRTGLGRAAGVMMAVEDYSSVPQVKYARFYMNRVTIADNIIGGLSLGVRFWNSGYQNPANNYGNIVISHNVIKDIMETPIRFDPMPYAPDWGNGIRNNVIYKSYKSVSLGLANKGVFEVANNIFPNGPPEDNFGTSNFVADPAFVSPVIGGSCTGFRVQPGSPAIGNGRAEPKVTIDYWGTPRSPTAPSVGIHER